MDSTQIIIHIHTPASLLCVIRMDSTQIIIHIHTSSSLLCVIRMDSTQIIIHIHTPAFFLCVIRNDFTRKTYRSISYSFLCMVYVYCNFYFILFLQHFRTYLWIVVLLVGTKYKGLQMLKIWIESTKECPLVK